MISNIEKYASAKGISGQDALQVFMQVVVLKNLNVEGVFLIGGTSLVVGHANPRFSEDIDLTGVKNPSLLKPGITKGSKMLEGFLVTDVKVTPPKSGRSTWRMSCRLSGGLGARLHIDSQIYPPITQNPLMIEYPGISPFVFPSVKVEEIMADKLVALAFRRNLSGRDIFDIWYHWLKAGDSLINSEKVREYLSKKLLLRSLNEKEFIERINSRLKDDIPQRVKEEWDRYLPPGLKDKGLYDQIFSKVKEHLSELKL